MADYCILKGRLCLPGRGDVPFIWIDCAGLCFSQSSQDFQGHFRHSSSLACVCLFSARGGEGICEIIEIPTSWFMYSIGFGTDRDLPDGDLFSMCVRFCFGPHLGGVLAV